MRLPRLRQQVPLVGFKVAQLDGKASAAHGQRVGLAQVVGNFAIALRGS